MTKRFTLAVALFLLPASSGAVAPSLQAQEPVRVSSDVVCLDCVITIDTVVTLGGLDGEGVEAIAYYSDIAVDARERILITNGFHPRIYVFDMAGRFLADSRQHRCHARRERAMDRLDGARPRLGRGASR